jgi:osmoprotectant transport system ATP-binding protein
LADTPLVEFRNVTFAVNGGAPIIDELSLTVATGETLVLLGESGCGKTTTLRLVNRLLTPTAGEVLVEAKATTEWDATRLRRRTGYVIQEAGLFPHFTVAENVAVVPSLENWDEVRTRDSLIVIRASCREVSASGWALRVRSPSIRRCF